MQVNYLVDMKVNYLVDMQVNYLVDMQVNYLVDMQVNFHSSNMAVIQKHYIIINQPFCRWVQWLTLGWRYQTALYDRTCNFWRTRCITATTLNQLQDNNILCWFEHGDGKKMFTVLFQIWQLVPFRYKKMYLIILKQIISSNNSHIYLIGALRAGKRASDIIV